MTNNNNNDGTWTWLDLHISSSFFCNKTMCRTSDATIIRVALICVYLILRSACKPLKTAQETKCDNETRRKRQKGRKSAHSVYIHTHSVPIVYSSETRRQCYFGIYICIHMCNVYTENYAHVWNKMKRNKYKLFLLEQSGIKITIIRI